MAPSSLQQTARRKPDDASRLENGNVADNYVNGSTHGNEFDPLQAMHDSEDTFMSSTSSNSHRIFDNTVESHLAQSRPHESQTTHDAIFTPSIPRLHPLHLRNSNDGSFLSVTSHLTHPLHLRNTREGSFTPSTSSLTQSRLQSPQTIKGDPSTPPTSHPPTNPKTLVASPASSNTMPHPSPPPSTVENFIRIKNRRKVYLEQNPFYFSSRDLELADPLSYDKLVRRFQSAAEREADGKAKGWSGVLEADLWRGEAKILALKNSKSTPNVNDENEDNDEDEDEEDLWLMGESKSKEEGLERWKYLMTQRFIHGLDSDFEYAAVDENEAYDEIEIREEQERWFEDEEPEWIEDVGGETGVQDF